MIKNLAICLLFLVLSCSLMAQTDTTCFSLNAKDILSIQMKKVNPKNATLSRELYLSPKDIVAFANQWNICTKDISETVKPEYFFFVTLKNKTIKYFAAGGNQITENKCQMSHQTNADFLNKLWNSLRE